MIPNFFLGVDNPLRYGSYGQTHKSPEGLRLILTKSGETARGKPWDRGPGQLPREMPVFLHVRGFGISPPQRKFSFFNGRLVKSLLSMIYRNDYSLLSTFWGCFFKKSNSALGGIAWQAESGEVEIIPLLLADIMSAPALWIGLSRQFLQSTSTT